MAHPPRDAVRGRDDCQRRPPSTGARRHPAKNPVGAGRVILPAALPFLQAASRQHRYSANVRPGRDLHRRAMIVARRKGLNLNAVVSEALRRYLDREDQVA